MAWLRDASIKWMRDWHNFLESEGYAVGTANPALFLNKQKTQKDHISWRSTSAIDHIGNVLASRYSVERTRPTRSVRSVRDCGSACCSREQASADTLGAGPQRDGIRAQFVAREFKGDETMCDVFAPKLDSEHRTHQ